MKLLLSGDLHIGRSSSRLPPAVRQDEIRAAAAWGRIVDLAIAEQVRLVCLSGDVADQDNKFWEAVGPLEAGIRRLGEAGIRTVAVAGNHDFDVLPRLADQLPEHFTLLGRGGGWERLTVQDNGRAALHIDGWSFPRRQVHHSPLESYNLSEDPGTPTLGLVHGDLDAANSPYAPLDLARLWSLPIQGWLLGHIHACRLLPDPASRWVLYPGSPQALHPNETGPHGPWIVKVDGIRIGSPEHRPVSSVWYQPLEVDLECVTSEGELETALLDAIRSEAGRIVDEVGETASYISLRLRLVGRTTFAGRVREVAGRVTQDLKLPVHGAFAGVERIDVETLPAIDLAEYAGDRSAAGALARLLLELAAEGGSTAPALQNGEVAGLIRDAHRAIEQVEGHGDFAELDRRVLTDERVRGYLQTQARALLTELVSQST